MPLDRTERRRALAHQIERLDRLIVPWKATSNRASWIRAGVVIVGFPAALAIGLRYAPSAGWGCLAVSVFLFVLAVIYHRRLERWIDTLTIWRDLRADQLARLTLNWEELPHFTAPELSVKSSLAFDLDLTGPRSLHHLLDTTLSREGSRLLADWLTQTHPDPDQTHARQSLVRELVPLKRFRERFWLTFRLVLQEALEGEGLVRWLGVAFPERRLRWALPLATLLVAANLALFGLYTLADWPPYWLATLLAYAVFYFANQESLATVFGALLRLDAELDRFSAILTYLETYSYAGHEHLAALCAPFRDPAHSPTAHIRRIKLVTTGIGLRTNPVLGLLLNLILPWDVAFAYLAGRFRAPVTQWLPVWVELCYRIDALVALANYADLNPEYSFPEIVPDARPVLETSGLGHPLIPHEHKVRNDFSIATPGHVAIITGSNMAGKSTFIKTVGINLCLAYAGAPVDATRFRSAAFRLHTCVRISDSLVDGFSYFYAEVRCLKQLLDELQTESRQPLLYLIDEIFRGTNNRERLIGSRAYLQALLGQNGVGLLATHDLELAGLADRNPLAENYHFRDRVADGQLVFDYRIHRGPCPTTNALQIMRMQGLPVETDLDPPRVA